jgi:hypothetical protein
MVDGRNAPGATSILRRYPWISFGLISAAYTIFQLLFSPIGLTAPTRPWWVFLVIGATVMQPVLLGLWAGIGPGSAAMRVPLLLVALWLTVLAGGYKQWNLWDIEFLPPTGIRSAAASGVDSDFAAAMLGLFVTALVATIGFRRITRYSVNRVPHETLASAARTQFPLKFLLLMVTVCGLLLSLSQRVTFIPPLGQWSSRLSLIGIALNSLVVPLVLLPAPTLALILLVERIRPRVLATLIFSTALLSLLIMQAMAVATNVRQLETLFVFTSLQAGAVLVGVFSALPLRWTGYRLVPPARTVFPGDPVLSKRWL